MVNYKFYKSGDNIEIYIQEYSPLFDKESEQEVDDFDWEGITEDVDRVEERRKQTLKDNFNNLKRMARENFQGANFFMTLTFEENLQDIDKADRKLKYMFKKFRENYGETSFIGVREKQKRGALHYHLLVKNKKLTEYYQEYVPGVKRRGKITIVSQEQKDYQDFFRSKYWKHGIVNITLIDFVDEVGAYLAKYMAKGSIEEMKWQENRRLILRSQDIKKVEPLCENKDSELIKALIEQIEDIKSIAKEDIKNNTKRKRVFTNAYKTKFYGMTEYYDMNLNRLAVGIK